MTRTNLSQKSELSAGDHGVIALCLPFVLFVVAPLTFYLGNNEQFAASLSSVLIWMPLLCISLASFLYLPLRWSGERPGRILAGLLTGFAAAVWIQSQLLVWDLGPLDGRGLDWGRWSMERRIELAVWIAVIAASIGASLFIARFPAALARLVVIVGTGSILAVAATSDYAPKPASTAAEGIFDFHPHRNAMIVVVDTFQSDIFDEIRERWPEETAFLKGFTYYRNTLGGYPTTYASIPLVLNGKYYRNERPIKEFIRETNSADSLPSHFAAAGYGIALAATVGQVTLSGLENTHGGSVYVQQILGGTPRGLAYTLAQVLDGGIFRALPLLLKEAYYGEGDWVISRWLVGESLPPGIHGDDIRFLRTMDESARIASAFTGEFKYLHLAGAHMPLRMDESMRHVSAPPPVRDSYIRQARGVLAELRILVEVLQRLEIYEDMELVIVADHGSMEFPLQTTLEPAGAPKIQLDPRVQASAAALLLSKPAGAVSELVVSDMPRQISEVPCLFGMTQPQCAESHGSMNPQRERLFYWYEWGEEHWSWTQSYMPFMTEYVVNGHVWDVSAWNVTSRAFDKGKVVAIETSAPYALGTSVRAQDFSLSPYLAGGWSYAESTHRWTDGHAARIRLRIEQPVPHDLEVEMLAWGMQEEAPPQSQRVTVHSGEQELGSIEFGAPGRYRLRVPPAVLTHEGILELSFDIPGARPTSTCSGRGERRCRKLGIALSELVVRPAKAD